MGPLGQDPYPTGTQGKQEQKQAWELGWPLSFPILTKWPRALGNEAPDWARMREVGGA